MPRTASLILLAASLASASVLAQTFPSKPIRVYSPAPGGPTDMAIRLIQNPLAESMGQTLVIDYKGGMGGVLANAEVARSAPDGYTLAVVNDAHVVNHLLYAKLPYEGMAAFTPITRIITSPLILCVNAAFAPRNLAEAIAYGKANPGKAAFGSPTPGATPHLAMGLLMSRSGMDVLHVPYKGAPAVAQALVAGDLQINFLTPAIAMPLVKAGKLRVLATASRKRLPSLPDVPALSETLPGFEVLAWFGLVAPAKTPAAVVTRLNREVVRALSLPETREKLAGIGFEPDTTTPEEFAAFMAEQAQVLGAVVKQYHITAE